MNLKNNAITAFSPANVLVYICLIAVGYVLFWPINTPEFIFPTLCALFSATGVVWLSREKWTSFYFIFIFGHIVQFPLPILMILGLSSPFLSIEPYLWPDTPASMWAMVVGMCGLLVAGLLNKVLFFKANNRRKAPFSTRPWTTPIWFNTALSLIGVGIAAFYISKGIYYHSAAGEYDIDASQTFGFVGYLAYVALMGPLLQVRRYLKSKSKVDLIYTFVNLGILFVTLAPSGSRRSALIVFVITGLYYFQHETNQKLKRVIFAIGVSMFMVLMPILQAYRTAGVAGANGFGERLVILKEFILTADFGKNESSEAFFFILGRRLADNMAVGYIVNRVPTQHEYWGYKDVASWPYYLIPSLLRPKNNTIVNEMYGAVILDEYGFRGTTVIGGSSPLMILGDLYNRSGWIGIFVGMLVIGLFLKRIDVAFEKDTFQRLIMWGLMMDTIMNIHNFLLIKLFMFFTRQVLIFYIIALVLDALLSLAKNKVPALKSADAIQ